ncbi:MAG TPA: L-histidine N(alpha)-methyltransferase [Thermoanaerobaculia bacterium]|nr:L-histidine N(alpha)-methyltransferase [Thermoanaerobaculia bacterium]
MSNAFAPRDDESRFVLHETGSLDADFAADVRQGLTASPKTLPPRWFYDDLGSSLFDAICNLPEYYVTRAETEILTARAAEMARAFGTPIRLVELGSGSARKTRILLDAITERQPQLEYVEIDVDAGMLEATGRALLSEYPELRVIAVRADFAEPSRALRMLDASAVRTIVLFLGSSIGNLDPQQAAAMLRDLRTSLREGDALFLGADLRKAKQVLEPAYDDALGVTAAFNKNVLQRMNRELGADFDLASFTHRAVYDEELGRVEMHLVSTRAQTVRVDALDLTVAFAEGETIHTENSWKYDRAGIAALANESGFAVESQWSDSRRLFLDALLVAV